MTPVIQRFLELERKKADIKQYFNELKEATEALSKEIGIGGHFQDNDGVVYQVVVPVGRFVPFDQIGYVRTRRLSAEEKKGDLSLTAARELGYEVEGK
jgi:hypothetical protein